MERPYFIFYRSFREAIRPLARRSQGALLLALIDYALDGTEPADLRPTEAAIFAAFRPTIERARRNYQNGIRGGSLGVGSNNPNGCNGKPDEEALTEEQKREQAILAFARFYNSRRQHFGAVLRPVKELTDARRDRIADILRTYSSKQWATAVDNIMLSDFANGRGSSSRRKPVDFDWVIQPANFLRFYENSL